MLVGDVSFESGVDVPGDVSSSGSDGIPSTRMVRPEIAAVGQPLEEMCEDLLAMMLQAATLVEEADRHTASRPSLLQRESVESRSKHDGLAALRDTER